MTKIIHPYQLLEAPQVNILNNNIVEDVNYSYDEIDYNYQEIGSVYQNVYEFPEAVTSGSGEVGYIGLENLYTFIGDTTSTYIETISESGDVSYLIYLFNFPYSGVYNSTDFQISEYSESAGYIGTSQNKPFLRFLEENYTYYTTSQYSHTQVFSNAQDALQYVRTSGNKYAIFKNDFGFGVYARKLKTFVEVPKAETIEFKADITGWTTKDVTITATSDDPDYEIELKSEDSDWSVRKDNKITVSKNQQINARLKKLQINILKMWQHIM